MKTALRVVCCCLLVVLAGCSGTGVAPTPGGDDAAGGTGDGDSVGTLDAPADGALAVHFVAVGQGDATLVVAPSGETMLVDTGDYEDDGEHVVDYLRAHGIDRIDHLVTTHADADHVGGHAAVIEYLETEGDGVGAVYDPGIVASTRTYEEYLDAVERYDVPLYETHAGDDVPLAGVELAVLGPPEEYLDGRDRNENSIVLRLGHGERSFLLTGDVEAGAESWLLDRYGDGLDATVLKVGHHGSSSSSTAAFLDAVSPRVAVVSSAFDSEYGHPHEEVLDRLVARSIPTFWTGTHGDVVVRTDGQRVVVASQRAAPTDAATLRSGEAVAPSASDPVEPRLGFGAAAGGGPGTSAVAADGGTVETATADGAGELRLVTVNADAAGRDGENLNDEYVVFENAGDRPLDLSGWTVRDAATHEYTFGDVTLDPGERLTLHTGRGDDTATDVYWNADAPLWNNDGDTVVVERANGTRVLEEQYE
ncbi:lamin tail domain-containing protein [Halomarina oriensis]|uniref:MBL fold metallo-hydrolase n=1 Tax=Halomarina oriensis TaxID=671145 RepID=A0A6B0GSP6_9EURY|nr:lamin tail domain-containing protein [Halomarina oriensis]MWG36729.1 MBL fold metallo-hydrolase [Halomarina oriensis]